MREFPLILILINDLSFAVNVGEIVGLAVLGFLVLVCSITTVVIVVKKLRKCKF